MEKTEQTGMCPKRLERLNQWLSLQVECGRLAGTSVLVSRRGTTAFTATAGFANKEQNQSFNHDTLVRLYSMTKPVTTVAAMMLYERGCFHLDDPIALCLPEFRDTPVWQPGKSESEDILENLAPQQQPITVRQLMNHTSGLTYGFLHQSPVDQFYRDRQIDFNSLENSQENLETMVRRLAEAPLLAQPGTNWNYGVSTDVLGRLVEIWSGKNLDQFFREEIFDPLGMKETGFHAPANSQNRCAALYGPADGTTMASVGKSRDPLDPPREPAGVVRLDEGMESAMITKPDIFSGGGGLIGSLHDYARFCQMLLNQGSLDGKRLLGSKTVRYMLSNHLPNNNDMAAMGQAQWSETTYEGIGFGLGFAVVVDPVKAHIITSVGECHWGGAASTFFWIDPVEDLFVVFLTQLMPSSTYPIRRELRTLVCQAIVD